MKTAIEVLKQDHVTVKTLFREFEDATASDVRADLFGRIHDELTIHTQVEEEFLYPALKAIGSEVAEHAYDEAHEEHAGVKQLLHGLTKTDPTSAKFVLDMGKVIQAVEHHIKEEEDTIFPLMKKRISTSKLQAIGVLIGNRKNALAAAA